jgi:hypothetical protein
MSKLYPVRLGNSGRLPAKLSFAVAATVIVRNCAVSICDKPHVILYLYVSMLLGEKKRETETEF